MRTELPLRCAFGAFGIAVSLHAYGQTTPSGVDIGGQPPSVELDNAQQLKGFKLDYGAGVGVGESDNVTLANSNRVSQTITTTDLDFDLKERSRRLDADAKGDFSYLNFLQGAYGSELIGRFNGTADVALLPERLTWQFADSFGQSQIDPFAPVTPANHENVNYVSTGPDLRLRFGPLFFTTASARYGRVTYQTSPFDSNRFDGDLGFGMQLSASSSVSLNGGYERVLFDTTELNGVVVNTDFTRSHLFGRYELTGSRTDLNVSVGATKAEQAAYSTTDPTARVKLERRMSSASKLTLIAGRDVTDASTGFNNMQGGAIGGVGLAPASQALVNYAATYGSAGWQYIRNRTTVVLSASWERDAYKVLSSLNSTREDGQFRIERRLTRALSVQAVGAIDHIDYPHPSLAPIVSENGASVASGADSTQTLSEVGGSVIYRWPRGLELRLRYQHTSRIAGGVSSGSNYDENRAFLTVGYYPGRIVRE